MSSKTKLVLLPGMDGTGILFHPLLKLLPDSFEVTVIAYPTDKKLSYDELVLYVKSKLPQTPFTLIAESFSGPIAYRLSFDHSLLIERIIFAASFFSNPNPNLMRILKVLPLKHLIRLKPPGILLKHFCFGNFINKELTQLFLKALKKVNPEVLIDRINSLSSIEKTDKKITQPCLNIIASKDRLLSNSAGLEISKKCENVKVINIC